MATNNKDFIVKNGISVGSNASITGSLSASGLNYPTSDGDNKQALITDGSGSLSFEDIDVVVSDVTNDTGSLIAKGTPVYQTGAAGNTLTIAPSDASNSATMPAIGVLEDDIADGNTGRVIHFGQIKGVDTSSFSEGDRIYVADGGGYTDTRPTGESLIVQFLGVVTKVHATNGGGVVFGGGRAMDVPNLDDGNVFIGTTSNTATTATLDTDLVVEATNQYFTNARAISAVQGATNLTIDGGTLYVDTSNNYIGINDTSPSQALDVTGAIAVGGTTVIDSGAEIVTDRLKSSGVTSGTYGSSSAVPVITVDSKGRVTSASTASITTTLGIAGDSGTDSVALASETLTFAGDTGITTTVTNNNVSIDLDDTAVTTGTYGSASAVPVITIDQQGRITSASTTAVAGVSGVSYAASTGILTVSTSAGTDYTVDLGTGTGDDPTFGDITADSITVNGNIAKNSDYNISNYYKADGTTRLAYTLFRDNGSNILEFDDSNAGNPYRIYANNKLKLEVATNGSISFYDDTGANALVSWNASSEFFAVGGTTQINSAKISAWGNQGIATTRVGSSNFIKMLVGSGDEGRIDVANASRIMEIPSNGSEVVFNQGAEDRNFRVESSGSTHALFVDAGNNNVGVRTSSPDSSFAMHVNSPGLLVSSSSGSSGLKVERGTELYTTFQHNSSTGFMQWGQIPFKFQRNGADVIGIDDSRNVTVTGANGFGSGLSVTDTTMGGTSGTWDLDEVDASTVTQKIWVGNKSSNGVAEMRIMNYGSSDDTGGGGLYFTNTRFGSAASNSDLGAIVSKRESYGTGYMRFFTNPGGGNTEKMRITGSGNLLVGTTYNSDQGLRILHGASGRGWGIKLDDDATNSTYQYIEFLAGGSVSTGGSVKGSIVGTSSGTTYNTTSDRRLKDNIKPIKGAKNKLLSMKPCTFTFKADEDKKLTHGFIAQEMKPIMPEAVNGDPGDVEMMSMDYGRITPVIVAALQEALNEIDSLKRRVKELENK